MMKPPSLIHFLACFPLIGVLLTAELRGSVVLDGSVGPAGARQGPNYVIPQSLGHLSGTNLFQSFSTLDIGPTESVTFTASTGSTISRVIARVTGGAPSQLNGLLRNAVPNSDFYLINAAGVIFGPSARIDVPGSFTASTASYVRFSDGGRFSSTLGSDGTFSATAPAAFGFLNSAPAKIAVNGDASQSTALSVQPGHSISLIGGGVAVTGGQMTAVGGAIDLVSVASSGEVVLPSADASVAGTPDVSGFATLGPVDLLGGSVVTAPVGGRLIVRAGSLNLQNSTINTDTDFVTGGGVDIGVTGAIDIDRGRISAQTLGTSRGGDIHLASDSLSINGLSTDGLAALSTNTSASGAAGDISINTGSFSITANGSVTAFTSTSGNGGNISLSASREVHIDGTGSGFLTGLAVETLALQNGGNAGAITIQSPKVQLVDRAEVTSSTKGSGNGGILNVRAGQLQIDGQNAATLTGLQARVGKGSDDSGATGRGGEIDVNAKSIKLIRGGVITATNFGRGTGGNIVVRSGQIHIVGSPAAEFTGFFARTAPDQRLAGGGGPGGSISLSAGDVSLKGNAAVSAVSTDGGGKAGSVIIHAHSLTLSSGASVTVQADTGIEGGDISIDTSGNLDLFHSTISAQAAGDGQIKLIAHDQLLVRASTITAQGSGKGGGQITIDPPAVVLDRSTINGLSAGIPVQVKIAADSDFISSKSQILSAAISIPPEIDVAGSLIGLPVATLAGSARLEPQCGVKFIDRDVSSFLVTGRGGEPPSPGTWIPDLDLGPR